MKASSLLPFIEYFIAESTQKHSPKTSIAGSFELLKDNTELCQAFSNVFIKHSWNKLTLTGIINTYITNTDFLNALNNGISSVKSPQIESEGCRIIELCIF